MKRCQKAARFVIIEDPDTPNPLCKDHGPENRLKKMNVLYRKARAGETCGQEVEVDDHPSRSPSAWSAGGDESRPFQPFKGGFSGSIPRQPRKIGATYRVRPPKKK